MPKKILLFSLGWVALALGVAGLFLPLLPTTCFVLLASWCFARSSQRFHLWLRNNRHLGPMIIRWEAGEGISIAVRNRAITILWLTLIASCLAIAQWWAVALLPTVGLAVSLYLFRLSRLTTDEAKINPAVGN
ncbi:YbaN family protein [Halioxenophilus sp. WMMB6]|uniref:YbaN family protein n=1 Tax=Halioxenophilus sp. WMMB6 TaxID=3073815 RepID=UPI00295F0D7C|nr:YbaN family protein [Halioxenophilus sp. WMMB6]